MKLKLFLFVGLVLTLLFSLSLLPRSVKAQFTGNLASISGTVTWGTELPQLVRVRFQGNTTGFTYFSDTLGLNKYVPTGSFDSGFNLPPDTYTVTALTEASGNAPKINLGSQSVVVSEGQSVTGINIDASTVTGMVKGNLKINGVLAEGVVQICGPLESDPCPTPYDPNAGPYYNFQTSGFSIPLLPGNYRVHIFSRSNLSVGIIPVTVSVGQKIEDPSLRTELNFASISGNVTWGTEPPQLVRVRFQGNSTGFTYTSDQLGFGRINPSSSFDTGFNLPPDTYTVIALTDASGNAPKIALGSTIVTVVGGQSTTGVNIDASAITGLIKGTLKINGIPAEGVVQICGPLESDPCPTPYDPNAGQYYNFETRGFSVPLLPGSYRIHVLSRSNVSVGIIPLTITAGQKIEDSSLQLELNFASISGTVTWGTELPQRARVRFQGSTTGFTYISNSLGFGNLVPTGNFSSGFNLPPDTYTVTAFTEMANSTPIGGTPNFILGSQTVIVTGGQSVTGINIDASVLAGLVKGNLIINGTLSEGGIQICGPLETDPCPTPFDQNIGPVYNFETRGFSIPFLPGNYRLHVYSRANVSMGIIPLTINAGQKIDLSTNSVYVPAGQDVEVSLAGININFTEVTSPGFMTLTTTTNPQGGQPPTQYRFLGTYYELTTTAEYTGPVTVSFTYNDADVHGQESNLKLFHWDGSAWHNITTSVDTINNIITGVTPTLSPFAIGDLLNSPPTASAGGPYDVDEGSSITLSGAGTDPDGDILTYAWDLDHNGTFETSGQNVNYSAADIDGPAVKTVDLQVCDDKNSCATSTAIVNINNVAPTAGTITLDPFGPQIINTTINTNVSFSDLGKLDTHTAIWNWGDGNSTDGVVTESNGSGSVTGSHTYTSAGVYTLTVTVTDNNSAAATKDYKYIVIYDPSAGFVTGGGQVSSSLFGISAKYTPNSQTPSGNVGYTFSDGTMIFASTQIDWLVVNDNIAILTGSGTINGTGNYYFLVSVIDDSPDKLRIRISDTLGNLIYDNQPGDSETSAPATAISAGQIKIH
jgi:hypothetical protein